jgi:hypothetical protein
MCGRTQFRGKFGNDSSSRDHPRRGRKQKSPNQEATSVQAKRLKELERENERLKKAVSGLTWDKPILKEGLTENFSALPGAKSDGRAWR